MNWKRYTALYASVAVAAVGLGLAGAEHARGAESAVQGPVIAHRGLTSPDATENGRGAIKAALRAGYDGVEVDVRLTEDGKQIVMHDATVDRTTGCTGAVTALTYSAVRKCRLNSGELVPNLFEVAYEFSRWDSASDKLWIHVKFDPTSAQRAALFKAVDKYGLRKKVVILADEDDMLDDFAKWSGIQRALIFNQADVNQSGAESWTAGYDYAVPYQTPVTGALVASARRAGSKVYAVENNPLTAFQAAALGLDGLLAG